MTNEAASNTTAAATIDLAAAAEASALARWELENTARDAAAGAAAEAWFAHDPKPSARSSRPSPGPRTRATSSGEE